MKEQSPVGFVKIPTKAVIPDQGTAAADRGSMGNEDWEEYYQEKITIVFFSDTS